MHLQNPWTCATTKLNYHLLMFCLGLIYRPYISYSTCWYEVVTHLNTEQVNCCLTSKLRGLDIIYLFFASSLYFLQYLVVTDLAYLGDLTISSQLKYIHHVTKIYSSCNFSGNFSSHHGIRISKLLLKLSYSWIVRSILTQHTIILAWCQI